MKSVSDIDRRSLCIGCGLCISLAKDSSVMTEGSDGFLHPKVERNDKPFMDIVMQTCPGLQVTSSAAISNKLERIWGPVAESRLGYACDKEIRFRGSSGGGISALLLYMLEKKFINAIVQTGVSKKNPLRSETFISRTREDIIHCSSSRYCPSSPLSRISEALSEPDAKIAFVGRPCDVTALRKYLNLYPELKSKVILLISFFCASTPSYNATDILLKEIEIDRNNIAEFWYRGRGWPGAATGVTKTGDSRSLSYMESWGKILSNHAHFRCKVCPDGVGCSADISFADAWEIENGNPVFHEKEGRNAILVRTVKGLEYLNKAVSDQYINTSDFNLNELSIMQPSQAEKRTVVGARLLALRFCGEKYPRCFGLPVFRNLLYSNPRNSFINFAGTLRRRLFTKKHS